MEIHMNEPLFGSVIAAVVRGHLSPNGVAANVDAFRGPAACRAPCPGWRHLRGAALQAASHPSCRHPADFRGHLCPDRVECLSAPLFPRLQDRRVAVGVPVPALLATVAVRRGQPLGPTNDQEIEDFIYDAFELLPGAGEVDVRCEGGRVTVSGAVQHKRLKRDVGEIAWAIPGVNDVHNTITIAARRRSRGVTQGEPQAAGGRKPA